MLFPAGALVDFSDTPEPELPPEEFTQDDWLNGLGSFGEGMSKVGGKTTLTAEICPDAMALAKEFHPTAVAAGDIYKKP